MRNQKCIRYGKFINGKYYVFSNYFNDKFKQLWKDGNKLGKRKSKYLWNITELEVQKRIENIKNGTAEYLDIDELLKERNEN